MSRARRPVPPARSVAHLLAARVYRSGAPARMLRPPRNADYADLVVMPTVMLDRLRGKEVRMSVSALLQLFEEGE
jgi:hypothetical protein